jgi:hypothetical protein
MPPVLLHPPPAPPHPLVKLASQGLLVPGLQVTCLCDVHLAGLIA